MNSGNAVTSSFTMPAGDDVATQGGLRDTAKIATAIRLIVAEVQELMAELR